MSDHYATLEVSQTADLDTIRKAYQRLAKLKHPDKNPDNPKATENFQKLQEAYETLSEPSKRSIYDAKYHPASKPPGGANHKSTGPDTFRTARAGQSGPSSSRPTPASEPTEAETPEMKASQKEIGRLTAKIDRSLQTERNLINELSVLKGKLAVSKAALEVMKAEASLYDCENECRNYYWQGNAEFAELVPLSLERDLKAATRRESMVTVGTNIAQLERSITIQTMLLEIVGIEIRMARSELSVANLKKLAAQAGWSTSKSRSYHTEYQEAQTVAEQVFKKVTQRHQETEKQLLADIAEIRRKLRAMP